MKRIITVAAAFLLVFGLAACGTDDPIDTADETPTDATTPATTPTTEAPGGTAITTGDSEFGTMLFDTKKQAIYIWEVETSSTPKCYGDCAALWPPVLTDGDPVARGEVNADLLGTAKRKDGKLQVTYKGHPLYYYAHEGPGEVECHNFATHGGLWWVVQPDGNRAP